MTFGKAEACKMGASHSHISHITGNMMVSQYHLLCLGDADMNRMYVPEIFLPSSCQDGRLKFIGEDSLGVRYEAFVQTAAGVNYIGKEWQGFLEQNGAHVGDFVFFHHTGSGCYKVVFFAQNKASQKYPDSGPSSGLCLLGPQIQGNQLLDLKRSSDYCVMQQLSDKTSTEDVRAECRSQDNVRVKSYLACEGIMWNATRKPTSEEERAFFFGKALSMNSDVPMYYFISGEGKDEHQWLSFDMEYSIRFLKPRIVGYSQLASIKHEQNDAITGVLFVGFDGRVHLSEGWAAVIDKIRIRRGSRCVLRFERFGTVVLLSLFTM